MVGAMGGFVASRVDGALEEADRIQGAFWVIALLEDWAWERRDESRRRFVDVGVSFSAE